MNNNDINVLLDNRNEYINYLETTLITVISEFFFNINLNCESLKQFQKELSLIMKSLIDSKDNRSLQGKINAQYVKQNKGAVIKILTNVITTTN